MAFFILIPFKGSAHAAHCEDTDLSLLMKDMKFQLKSYVGAFKQKDDQLMQSAVSELEQLSIQAKDHIPLKILSNMNPSTTTVMDLNEFQLEDYKNYKLGINQLLIYIEKLKMTSDKDTIQSLLKKIKKHSKKSHKLFLKDCD
jgi:hypothetical protein